MTRDPGALLPRGHRTPPGLGIAPGVGALFSSNTAFNALIRLAISRFDTDDAHMHR